MFDRTGARVVVDSAFNSGLPASRDYLIKSSQHLPISATAADLRLNREATAVRQLSRKCFDQGVYDIPITFALGKRVSKAQQQRETNEFGLFAPTTKWDIGKEAEDTAFLERTPIASIKARFSKQTAKVAKDEANLRMRIQKQLARTTTLS